MTTRDEPPTLVLASASPARRMLMEGAGLKFDVVAADIDEGNIRDGLLAAGTAPVEIARALARAKAEDVASQLSGGEIIIAADQLLLFEGELFEKPADHGAARETLCRLRGKTHELISAVSAHKDGAEIWSCCESARLTMRDFSDDFLDSYMQQDEDQLSSVGAYRIEGRGAQLFSAIDGDFFTILGLPLLPLLDFLRREKLLSS